MGKLTRTIRPRDRDLQTRDICLQMGEIYSHFTTIKSIHVMIYVIYYLKDSE